MQHYSVINKDYLYSIPWWINDGTAQELAKQARKEIPQLKYGRIEKVLQLHPKECKFGILIDRTTGHPVIHYTNLNPLNVQVVCDKLLGE